MDVAYEIAGCMNNVPVAVEGRGTIDPARACLVVEHAAIPHLDPAPVALFWLDALVAVAAQATPLPENGLPEPVRSVTMLFDEQGREAGRTVCVGLVTVEGGVLTLRMEVREAALRMEPGELVTRVSTPYSVGLVPAEPARIAMTSAWSFDTDRGNGYWGVTTTCRDVEAGPGSFGVRSVRIERGAGVRVGIDAG